MLCQRCKKNTATLSRPVTINGVKFESHLCAMCYADLCGELDSKSNSELWANILRDEPRPPKTCPSCGTGLADYERTGLLGCPSCYDVFKKELLPSIERIQGKTTHVGKSAGNNDELGLHRKLKSLQAQLERALKERRFDEAGRLNKMIIEISKTLYGEGGGND